ncbi:guanylate-binding protein 1-like [Pyxicephalus adspersus]|uniref:guanylate-binding protein 1-like n=1 Tax=Pyxicephalus adspersus TaxID=30357 RepID=UPI003B5A3F24
MESAIKMDKPICLIENREEGGKSKLVVNPEAIRILSNIYQPVVVVSIVGLYRTGKSYLMNRLAGVQKGFSLGSTIESNTKGIWMWCVPHPIHRNRVLVLLDTEGLGDVKKGNRVNDSKIFTLAVLLSSALVYNSMGTITQDALDKLKFVGEITELIKVRTGGIQNQEGLLSRHFPIFIWTVRDIYLELKIKDKNISADEYLEDALEPKTPERSSEEKEYNELRNRIRMYFGNRKCFVFCTPTDSNKQLKELEQLPDEKLDKDFVAQSCLFCDYIFKNADVKRVDITVEVTGHRLGKLAEMYTNSINSSNVACLEEVVVSLAEKENKIAVQEATKHYEEMMKTIPLPTETIKEFLDLSTQHEEKAREIFLKRSIKDEDQKFLNKFTKSVKKARIQFSQENEKKSREVCEALIKKHSADFEKDLATGTFNVCGGHERFRKTLKAIEQEYKKEKGKGLKAEEVLQEYKTTKQAEEVIIIQADNALTQKQKEEEVENSRKEKEEMEKRLQQLEEQREKEKSKEEKDNLRRTVEQLMQKLEDQESKWNEKLEQVAREKEMEYNSYMERGQLEQAKKYEEQIKNLQAEKEEKKNQPFWSKMGLVVEWGLDKLIEYISKYGKSEQKK